MHAIVILHTLAPTWTDLQHWRIVLTLLTLVALGLAFVAVVVNKVISVIKHVLNDLKLLRNDPEELFDVVAERRRVRAEAFAERQQQLAAAALGRRR